MKHLRASTVVLLLALFNVFDAGAAEPAAKPNIVFIMADDLGYTDVACFGSKYYETPNLDRLATQGMKLRRPVDNNNELRSMRQAISRRIDPALNFSAS